MSDAQNKNLPTQTNQSSNKLLNMLEILTEQNQPIRLQDIGYAFDNQECEAGARCIAAPLLMTTADA